MEKNYQISDILSADQAFLSNFFPSRFKSSLKGTHFHSVEYIHQELAEWLRALSQNDFMDCFEAWKAYMEQ